MKGGALPHMAAFPNTNQQLFYLVLVGAVVGVADVAAVAVRHMTKERLPTGVEQVCVRWLLRTYFYPKAMVYSGYS